MNFAKNDNVSTDIQHGEIKIQRIPKHVEEAVDGYRNGLSIC